ncbi:hypothetical protein RhiirB3_449860 [Rhizophagus irregularis]|nr:hypothetical protein RhiirB3_449860 [Rhizophagus irregularis]
MAWNFSRCFLSHKVQLAGNHLTGIPPSQIIKKKPSTLKRKRAQSSQSKYDTSNMPLIGVPNNSDNSDNDIEDESNNEKKIQNRTNSILNKFT